MKKIVTMMAIAAMSASIMISCSGSGSSKGSIFGSVPEKCEQFLQEKEELSKEAENIQTEADKAKLIEKSQKMQEKWQAKIEESAKALDGKAIEFAESAIKVTEPVSLEFEKFFSESTLTPKFKVNGKAEAATDITTELKYIRPHTSVYLVGYNAEGQEAYKLNVGSIEVQNQEGNVFIPAGTPVEFSSFQFSLKGEDCKDAQTLKLEVR